MGRRIAPPVHPSTRNTQGKRAFHFESDAVNEPHDHRLADRLTVMEELFTHLERMVSDLNQSLLLQDRRLAELERRLDWLTARLDQMETGDG